MKEGEFKERVAELTRQELQEPEQWFYMSFADEEFRGSVVMLGHGITDCVSRTHRMGINPGGEVMCFPIPNEMLNTIAGQDRLRLLTKEDVQRIWPDAKSISEFEAEENSNEQNI